MSTTKNNTALTYPCIVNITKAMGKKRKDPVIRALALTEDGNGETGQDLSKQIVYPTLRNAYVAQFNLFKETIDSKWQRISKQDTIIALQAIKDTGKLPAKPSNTKAVAVKSVSAAVTSTTKPTKASKQVVAAKKATPSADQPSTTVETAPVQ